MAVVTSACGVQTTVRITVKDDGSGLVRVGVVIDAEAVKAVEVAGAKLETAVRFTGLTESGWTVGSWQRAADGTASTTLTHPFANVSEVRAIIASANGPSGPLRDVRATRNSGLLGTDYSVDGRGTLADAGTGVAADSELVKRLVAQGVDPKVIDQQLLAQLKASFALRVVVRLPGSKASTITLKPDGITRIRASSSVQDSQRMLLLAAAAGFIGLALVVWFRGGRSGRRRGGRATSPRSVRTQPRNPGPPPTATPASTPTPTPPSTRRPPPPRRRPNPGP